jgi:diadenosine tetraphosphate (Ap4A) HIT family hydrolase
MYRSRKIRNLYHKDPNHNLAADDTSACPFCNLDDRTIYADGEAMRVMANKYPYEYWDGRNVAEHLLLAPKRHVLTLSELTDTEKIEAIDLMSRYEADGYSVYWRSQTNDSRSVPHQHTHLFKLGDKEVHAQLYLRWPYYFVTYWKRSIRK